MAAPVVGVVGMSALRRDIKRLTEDQSSALYRAIRQAGKDAAEPVAARTRSTMVEDTGALVGTVRASGTRTGAAVRVGSARVPYAGWIDFGGTRPDGSSREYRPGGRYLFPAAEGLAPVSADLYSKAIGAVFNSDTVWTNTTNDGSAVHD